MKGSILFESMGAFKKFGERLQPVLQELGMNPGTPDIMDVHHVIRRGVVQLNNAWNGGAALSDPDILRTVHEDYIQNGAEIIISNTFGNATHALIDSDAGKILKN